MSSFIFSGTVSHGRVRPEKHSFQYPIYMYGFDLDELDELDRRIPFLRYNRFSIKRINDSDYLDNGDGTIKEKLLRLLSEKNIEKKIARVMLITAARYFNYVFNPVSFYFCYTPEDELACVVTEVNNTYGEKHVYVLAKPEFEKDGSIAVFSSKKEFHVSPFNNMEGEYAFRFLKLEIGLDIRLRLIRNGEEIFHARLEGKPSPLTPYNHLKTLLRHPIVPHLSMPRIYLQAARLWFQKKLTFYKKPIPRSKNTIRRLPPNLIQKMCMKIFFSIFDRLEKGGLKVLLPDGTCREFGAPSSKEGVIEVKDYRFFSRTVLTGGDVGLGESFTAEEWDSPDIVQLFKVFIDNRDALNEGNFALSILKRLLERYHNFATRNTLPGSSRNISSHYDLGNDFYALFLDDALMYSCAWFSSPEDTLEIAQKNKLQAIIQKAQIQPTDHVLEIGCGWGGFAIEAVKQTGCKVTAVTLSKAQYEAVSSRVKKAGLEDRIAVNLMDYRNISGTFDKIISIEMLEAVGHENYKSFFQQCERLLKPEGIMVLQVITIPDFRYDAYRKERDWIQKHIFPGGHLPSLTALSHAMAKHSRLMIEHAENIGIHYARTLREWRRRYLEHIDKASALGFDHSFHRKWRFYLSVCEAEFAMRILNDMQLVLSRPNNLTLPEF